MRIVTLGVSSREEIGARFVAAWHGEAQGAYLSFPTPELLFRALTPSRWSLLRPSSAPTRCQSVKSENAHVEQHLHVAMHGFSGAIDAPRQDNKLSR